LAVAEKKNTAFELQSQLAKGIFELFTNALNLANDSLKKQIDDTVKGYLNSKRYYFLAMSCVKMKDFLADDFKKTGAGYGKQIAYISLAVQALTVGLKEVVSLYTKISLKRKTLSMVNSMKHLGIHLKISALKWKARIKGYTSTPFQILLPYPRLKRS
jgi:hypothetical protein